MTGSLAHTPLHAWHAAHGGRLVDFAGWSMPVQYGSIVAEHRATRSAAGVFDVSHMGRVWFEGAASRELLERLLTRQVADLPVGAVRYALLTRDDGGILDDVLVSRLADRGGEPVLMLVVNASNRGKVLDWLESHRGLAPGSTFDDRTQATAMLAVQGPAAGELLAPLIDADLASMKYYRLIEARVGGSAGVISRTGYTGEDGWELVVPAERAAGLWERLMERGQPLGALPAGLGARDTLRLEAGMPLYGHELSEAIDPIQAGLAFAVDLAGRDFPGRSALAARRAQGPQQRRVGLVLSGGRAPREGYPVVLGERTVGQVTSGTHAPTLDRPIAMAYVAAEWSAAGQRLEVEIRGRRAEAEVVKLPFYRRLRSA
jgi:aminomethyltransferase